MVQSKAIRIGSVPGTTTFSSQSATVLDASFFSSLHVVFGLNRFLLSSLYVVLTACGSLCHSFNELTMVVGDFTSRSALGGDLTSQPVDCSCRRVGDAYLACRQMSMKQAKPQRPNSPLSFTTAGQALRQAVSYTCLGLLVDADSKRCSFRRLRSQTSLIGCYRPRIVIFIPLPSLHALKMSSVRSIALRVK